MAGAFLTGFNQQRQADAQGALNGIQQVTGVLSLQNTMRQQAEQDAVRGVLAQSPSLDAALPQLLKIGPTGISAAMQLAQVQQALKKDTQGQPIGAGGLRMPDGTIVAPAARPVAEQPHSIGAGGLRLPDGTVVPPVSGAPKEQWGEPFTMNGVVVQKNNANGQIRTAVTREPTVKVTQEAPVTPVTIQDPDNPNSTIIIDGRTRNVLGKGPKLTETGKLDNTRRFAMEGIGATINQARDLLEGRGGENPTGSVTGSLIDTAGALVGVTPEGAKTADQLRVLGGSLTSKVPRMQGPQSDKDVQLYKEMAGMVGNDKIPRARRLAALAEVERLYAKYENQNSEPPVQNGNGQWSIRRK